MKFNFLFFLTLACVFLPLSTHAGEFVGLVGIPGIEPNGDTDLNAYINALYRLSISIAALLAVIKIVAAGAKYMLTDIVPAKEEAKKDIQGALIGLLIVIGAVIILNTINSDLTNLDLEIETTTLPSGPTVQEVIAERIRSIEESVSTDQSEIQTVSCPYYTWLGGGDTMRCLRECNNMRGSFNPIAILNMTCTISTSQATTCDPNVNVMCCETVNGGDWTEGDNQTGSCSGLSEGRADLRLECGRLGRVWDEARNYCRTASCNVNTNANCCSAQGGTIQDNICRIGIVDQGTDNQNRAVCQGRGDIWTEPSGPCVPNNGRTIVPGSSLPVPPFAADLNPNIPGELNQINAACQGAGPDYVYSRELQQCVVYQ